MSYSSNDFVDSVARVVGNVTDAEELAAARELIGLDITSVDEISDDARFLAWSAAVCDKIKRHLKALQPFVAAYEKYRDPGTADLDDEQPVHITVTLGDLRRAERALR